MKKHTKILALALTLTFIMLLSSCSRTAPYGEGAVSGNKPLPEETTTVEETTEETTPEETTRIIESGIDIVIFLEKELKKPANEYTIEDFPEAGEVISYYFEDTILYDEFNIRIPNDTSEEALDELLEKLLSREDVHNVVVVPKSSLCMIEDPSACNT